MSNQKCTDRIVRDPEMLAAENERVMRLDLHIGSVRVDKSQMRRVGIPERRASNVQHAVNQGKQRIMTVSCVERI